MIRDTNLTIKLFIPTSRCTPRIFTIYRLRANDFRCCNIFPYSNYKLVSRAKWIVLWKPEPSFRETDVSFGNFCIKHISVPIYAVQVIDILSYDNNYSKYVFNVYSLRFPFQILSFQVSPFRVIPFPLIMASQNKLIGFRQ